MKSLKEYEVDKIVAHRINNGIVEYKIRWKGYGSEHDTWEPEANLTCCDAVMFEFTLKNGIVSEAAMEQDDFTFGHRNNFGKEYDLCAIIKNEKENFPSLQLFNEMFGILVGIGINNKTDKTNSCMDFSFNRSIFSTEFHQSLENEKSFEIQKSTVRNKRHLPFHDHDYPIADKQRLTNTYYQSFNVKYKNYSVDWNNKKAIEVCTAPNLRTIELIPLTVQNDVVLQRLKCPRLVRKEKEFRKTACDTNVDEQIESPANTNNVLENVICRQDNKIETAYYEKTTTIVDEYCSIYFSHWRKRNDISIEGDTVQKDIAKIVVQKQPVVSMTDYRGKSGFCPICKNYYSLVMKHFNRVHKYVLLSATERSFLRYIHPPCSFDEFVARSANNFMNGYLADDRDLMHSVYNGLQTKMAGYAELDKQFNSKQGSSGYCIICRKNKKAIASHMNQIHKDLSHMERLLSKYMYPPTTFNDFCRRVRCYAPNHIKQSINSANFSAAYHRMIVYLTDSTNVSSQEETENKRHRSRSASNSQSKKNQFSVTDVHDPNLDTQTDSIWRFVGRSL